MRAADRAAELPRRGLRREEAAAYVGVSPTKFDDWVERKLMPKPKRIDGVVVWDRFQLDIYFDALPDEASTATNKWGGVR